MSQTLSLTIELWSKQLQLVQSNKRHSAFVAGIASGKSVAGAAKAVRESLEFVGTGMIVAPTYQMLRDASLVSFKRVAGDLIRSINQSSMTVELINGSNILMRSADDPEHLRGPNISWVWIDEGSLISEMAWLIILGRCREGRGRIWVTTTPKGLASWLYEEFIQNPKDDTEIITADTRENPYLPKEYIHDIQSRYIGAWAEQELAGRFVDLGGQIFARDWFEIVETAPIVGERVRYWDKAGTSGAGAFSCGLRMLRAEDGIFFIEDVTRGQWGATERENIIKQVAQFDSDETGNEIEIWEEQEPGSGGKESAEATIRNLAGFPIFADRVTGSKDVRLQPFAAQAGAKNVKLVRGAWNKEYIEEMIQIPSGKYRDQGDGSSGAFNKLVAKTDKPKAGRAAILRY